MSICIILPVPPNRANDSRNHWKVHKDKTAYYNECGWLLKKYQKYELEYVFEYGMLLGEKTVNKTTIKPPFEFVELDFSFDVQKYYDWDNLSNLCKWPQDALVKNGIIKSDDWMHCRARSIPTQILKSKKLDKRELRITLYPRGPF